MWNSRLRVYFPFTDEVPDNRQELAAASFGPACSSSLLYVAPLLGPAPDWTASSFRLGSRLLRLGTRGKATYFISPDRLFWMAVCADCARFLQAFQDEVEGKHLLLRQSSHLKADVFRLLTFLWRKGAVVVLGCAPPPSPVEIERVTHDELRRVVQIGITQSCNFHCPHCLFDSGKPLKREADWPTLIAGLEMLLVNGVGAQPGAVTIQGGEPLLAPHTKELLLWLNRRRIQTYLYTNGWHLQQEWIEFLNTIRCRVMVSIDGSEDFHDTIRRSGSFARIVEAIAFFRQHGSDWGISMCVGERNVSEIDAVWSIAEKHSASALHIYRTVEQGRAASGGHWQPVALSTLISELLRVRRKHRPANFFVDSDLEYWETLIKHQRFAANCGLGRHSKYYCDAAGVVYPCNLTVSPSCEIGAFKERQLTLDVLRRRAAKLGENGCKAWLQAQTQQCAIRYWCGGGCRGEALHMTGNITSHYCDCEDTKKAVLQVMEEILLAEGS